MTSYQVNQPALPVTHRLGPLYVVTALIALLMSIAAGAGLLLPSAIYPTEELRQGFVANDVVNLVVGLPVLLGTIWYTRRGSLVGLLCWPGALLFVLYNYSAYLFAAPLTWAFLIDLTLVMLSLYALIALVVTIEGKSVSRLLAGAVPVKSSGGVLVGLGLLFLLRATSLIAGAILAGEALPAPELATNVADFLTAPAWILGGIFLWQHKEVGYAVGMGLLFQASMLFVALIVFLLLQPLLTAAPFAPVDVVVVFAMGLLCFVPFGQFVRGAIATRG